MDNLIYDLSDIHLFNVTLEKASNGQKEHNRDFTISPVIVLNGPFITEVRFSSQ